MRKEKWDMYINSLQSHPSRCHSSKSIESMRSITGIIDSNKYNKMLNIGAGEGEETRILRELGYNVTGIVFGETNFKYANTVYSGIDFINCDMHDLPFESGSFDSIYTDQVFEHCYAPFIFMLECFCVLKQGGLMYVRVPEYKDRITINDPGSIQACHISHHHPSLFNINIYRQIFEKTGFEVLSESLGLSHTGNEMEVTFLLKRGSDNSLHPDVNNVLKKRIEIFK